MKENRINGKINFFTVVFFLFLVSQTAYPQTFNKVFYSYTNGNWYDQTTWTTDPSGNIYVPGGIPGAGDRAVILNGSTVTIAVNGQKAASLEIEYGGILDIQSSSGHTFDHVSGKGILKLGSGALPAGNMDLFMSAEGGTVEYYGVNAFIFDRNIFNNLILNLSNPGAIAFVGNDFTVNGELTIKSGEFRIGTNTVSRSVWLRKDVTIERSGKISVYNRNTNLQHRVYLSGNFTNNGGEVKFKANNDNPEYTNDNYTRATVYFNNPTSDQTLVCNGITYFHSLYVDKGNDATHTLNVQSNNPNYFKILGRNDGQETNGTAGNINNNKALTILAGTLRLGPNIVIPCLMSGSGVNYVVDLDACLWIDGGQVSVVNNPNHPNSIVIYGQVIVSGNSVFTVNCMSGIVMREAGICEHRGGTTTTTAFRSSFTSDKHRGAFIMSGGTFNLTGRDGTGSADYATFSLPFPENMFKMSGGEITVSNSRSGSGTLQNHSWLVNSDAANHSVTGGTVTIMSSTREVRINSSIPFYNLNITGSNSAYPIHVRGNNSPGVHVPATQAYPLVVLNNLNIQNRAVFHTNITSVTVGGDFTIGQNAEYVPNFSITILNGSSIQQFSNAGKITPGLSRLRLINRSILSVTHNLSIQNYFSIEEGTIVRDNGNTIYVQGIVYNSGLHESQPGGSLTLNGANDQTFGGGIFGNVTLNKSTGAVNLSSATTITGNLRLAGTSAVLHIGAHNLTLGEKSKVLHNLTATGSSWNDFSSARMIRTTGKPSDGGVTLHIANVDEDRLIPFGVTGKYTPARISFTQAPEQWGNITVRPVNFIHPIRTGENILTYYWKVTSEGFSGIVPGSIRYRFYYVNADTRSDNTGLYVPGVYRPGIWKYFGTDKVSTSINQILFDEIDIPNGDFTAGYPASMYIPNTYHSIRDGEWSDAGTWTNDPQTNIPAQNTPTVTDPVIIREGHTVTITQDYTFAGSLNVREGSTLDIGVTIGHQFGTFSNGRIYGTGTIRVSSITSYTVLPGGNMDDFLGENGGTVEYYTRGTSFRISNPASGTTANLKYNNLVVNAENGRSISFGKSDIRVYGNLTVKGAGTGTLDAESTSITVDGDMNVSETAKLQYVNGTTGQVTVNGNMNIDGNASVNASGAGTSTSNRLNVYGNLINNGELRLLNGVKYIDLYFLGERDVVFGGTGTNILNRMYVNKGISQGPLLDITAGSLNLNLSLTAQPLIIFNGTVRFSGTSLNTTLSTTYPFNIPATGCLSVNGSNITVGSGANNAANLFLAGKLEVLAGTLNIGNPQNNNNNDIEYPGAGDPQMDISGGALNVNGQIRRSVNITSGSLRYKQSGGDVTIKGKNRQGVRALFEVVNKGSSFEMSGGSIVLVNGVGQGVLHPFTDFYLNPESSSATGGLIRIGDKTTTNGMNYFNLYLACPVWDLTVDGETNAKTAILRSVPAAINNNLNINGPQASALNTNNLDVVIGGDLVSSVANLAGGYLTTPAQNTTFVSKGRQARDVYGTAAPLVFGKLTVDINPGNAIRFSQQSIYTEGDVIFRSGHIEQLNEQGSTHQIIARKDVYLGNGIIWNANTRPFVFGGTSVQKLVSEGRGEMGCVQINNSSNVELNGDLFINEKIIFTNGLLNIGSYAVTLGENCSIEGTPRAGSMIATNGTLADKGVTRLVSRDGQSKNIIFPVGVAGKYTPATIQLRDMGNTPGRISVKPVNSYHPAQNDLWGNEMQYYWAVSSEGFNPLPSVTHIYDHSPGDVRGNIANYRAGRYTGQWEPENGIQPSHFISNKIIFNIGFIDGEYTGGEPANFTNKSILYSRVANGIWDGQGTWSTNPSGTPIYTGTPNGNKFYIQQGHTITSSANSAYAYSLDIAEGAVLDLGTTRDHNFGHVSGGGTIKITATPQKAFVFPGGRYDDFMDTPTSTVEYIGTGTIPATLLTYRNVIFSEATSYKYIPATNITIKGNMTIREGHLDNADYNSNITIGGNWENLVSGGFIPGKGTVTFNGATQAISAVANETFYNLRVNGANTNVTLRSPVNVIHSLYLINGYFFTDDTNILTLDGTSSASVIGGSNASFVHGPLRKNIATGVSFDFPTGDTYNGSKRYGNIRVFDTQTTGNQYWTAQYFAREPINSEALTSLLRAVSLNDYWTVKSASAGSANVRVRWDEFTVPIPPTPPGREELRIAKYINNSWESIGQQVTDRGTTGTVATTEATSFGTSGEQFTIGTEESSTARITGTNGPPEMCDDGSFLAVVVEFTGEGPWKLFYSVNGIMQPVKENLGSPYEITFEYGDLNVGDNIISLNAVYNHSGLEGSVAQNTITLTAKETPNPLIDGPQRATVNSSSTFRVPDVPDNTYFWNVSGISANGISSNTLPYFMVDWGNTTGTANISLLQTNSNTGCSRTVTHPVNVINWPVILGPLNVCAGSTETYRTNPQNGHTYQWSVTGGTVIGNSNGSTVEIRWSNAEAGQITLVQQGRTIRENISIRPLPVALLSVDDNSEICDGDNVTLILSGTDRSPLFTYRLKRNGTDYLTIDQSATGTAPYRHTTTSGHVWNPGSTVPPPLYSPYTYSLTVENNTTGCTASEAQSEVKVYSIGNTGPMYRISNDY